jgi:hypothetical protein
MGKKKLDISIWQYANEAKIVQQSAGPPDSYSSVCIVTACMGFIFSNKKGRKGGRSFTTDERK